MKRRNLSGNLNQEMQEIRKMQNNTPWILSLLTNTCTDIRTVICC